MPVCTKPDRSGQAVQHHRLARCDGGSAVCAGEALILPYKCTADEQAPAHLSEHRPGIFKDERSTVPDCGSVGIASPETTGRTRSRSGIASRQCSPVAGGRLHSPETPLSAVASLVHRLFFFTVSIHRADALESQVQFCWQEANGERHAANHIGGAPQRRIAVQWQPQIRPAGTRRQEERQEEEGADSQEDMLDPASR